MNGPSFEWVSQLDPLVRELRGLARGDRKLVAMTVSVPAGAPLEAAERLVGAALAYAGFADVQVTARPGGSLQVLAVEFAAPAPRELEVARLERKVGNG